MRDVPEQVQDSSLILGGTFSIVPLTKEVRGE
jgi:hypothetical protein